MSENAFKNLINPTVVKKISKIFHKAYPAFNEKRFQKIIVKLDDLELKARVLMITAGLRIELSNKFTEDKKIIEKVLAQKELSGFELWPVSEYISQYGTDHFDESLDLMYLLTQQFTSEFAVRPFLNKDPQRTLKKLKTWLKDENVHVRRWISEGTRPLLPWGGKIHSFITKPETLHLLEELKYDEELYVRKSVANHLNDISKHHPELVVKTLKEWVKNSPKLHLDKIHWIKRQALRTLIKIGHKNALSLMGVDHASEVEVSSLKLNQKKYKVGDVLEFEFVLESTGKKAQALIVDYVIGFVKSNKTVSSKVFKLKNMEIKAKEKIKITKRHGLKKITTMTFYPGMHQLSIQVNGKILKTASWMFDP
ncbi:MAG: DNA alkylation repair protein [Bdellovibrionales bacterium]|nr:DNA alkylation repair protein [Bdellovibrionales bacterium]